MLKAYALLKQVFVGVRNHKKKSILLGLIIMSWVGWKLKHKIPLEKIMKHIMGKIALAMEKQ